MKSDTGIYLSLIETLYIDIADTFSVNQAVRRVEIAYLRERSASEGLSFFTKTLPSWGKRFDAAISKNTSLLVVGQKKARNGNLPLFMGWLLSKIFTHEGICLPNPNAECVRHYRQFVYLLYKLELPNTKATNSHVLEKFEIVDKELPDGNSVPGFLQWNDKPSSHRILLTARMLCTRLLEKFDASDIVPRHGPGSVATGEDVLEKSTFTHIYRSLETLYPYSEYFVSSPLQILAEQGKPVEILDSPCAKIVLVPKDSRGPRIISCEPLSVQWIQQGIMKQLVPWIERQPITVGCVNFTDQTINRDLAQQSSVDGRYVTLDMKDASDRVSLALTNALFDATDCYRYFLAARSTHTRLPSGRVIELKKFAPMGSALCFPIEALCFYTLALAAIHHMHNISLTEIKRREMVCVYGDDLIIDSKVYESVMQVLPEFGLMFNSDKCCIGSHFRESCGMDAFAGVDVTPIKIRTVWSSSASSSLISYVKYSNSLYAKGYHGPCRLLEQKIQQAGHVVPYARKKNPGFICYERDHVHTKVTDRRFRFRFNRNLQRNEILAPSVVPLKTKHRDGDWGYYTRHFVSRTAQPDGRCYPLRRRISIKRRWHAF